MPNAAKARTPDYSPEAVRRLLQRCIDDAKQNTPRIARDRQDLKNLLFYRGGPEGQWVVWDQSSGSYVQRPYSGDGGLPEWIPRATSNVFANKIDGITSLLNSAQPALQATPSTDDDEDRAGADVAQHALPVILDEMAWPSLRRALHHAIALTDKAAVLYYFDADERYGMDAIDLLRCPGCQAVVSPMAVQEADETCPQCGQADEMEPAIDESAAPIQKLYPRGRMCARLLLSGEFSLPSSARSSRAQEAPWVLLHNREHAADLVREFGEKARQAVREGGDKRSLIATGLSDQIARLSAPAAAGDLGRGLPAASRASAPLVYRLQHDPIDDDECHYPMGLYAVMCGETILDAGPLPYDDDDGRPMKTILVRTFRELPGSAFGKPPADDLVPLQYQRNLVETLILMILMHDAAPRTFVPTSVSLEDEITGQPGQHIRYRSTTPGEKPTTDRGVNPPEGLYKFLEMIDEKFEQLSNMNAVLQGQRPDGDPTLGEVEILREQGQSAFGTPLANQVDFEVAQARLVLAIARQSMWSPRFRKVMGENGQWEVEQFSASTILGKVDWSCDPASAWPKSPVMQNLRIGKAIEWGILAPQTDPEIAAKLLEKQDLADLKPSLDIDRKQVARELDRWKAATSPEEILPPGPFINKQVHLLLKKQFLKTEIAERLAQENPPLFGAMVQHVQAIEVSLQAEAMQQAMLAGGGPSQGPPTTPAERGDSSALDSAIQSGVLQPAAPPEQTALPGAVQSGALLPAAASEAEAQAQQQAQQANLPSIDDMIASDVLRPVTPPPDVGGALR